ncbi:accessory gene regulator B family protein [Paenibacillus ehimensis]|uniref:accessory gene regulator B family protein n=1 Tax=Paenibacillus ehimensis TaxID=79264 RepID=UPI000A02DCAB
MNLIECFATKIAQTIRKNYTGAASEKVLIYSLSLLLNTIAAIVVTLFISILSGHFVKAVITINCFLFLRYFSGGVHFKSSIFCCIFSMTALTLLAHVNFNYFYLGLFFDILSFFILLIYAPNGLEKVSRINPKYYFLLKIVCLLFVSTNFFIQSSMLSAIILLQSLTLTKTGAYLFQIFERRWQNESKTL